jgi:hypothetical protein
MIPVALRSSLRPYLEPYLNTIRAFLFRRAPVPAAEEL